MRRNARCELNVPTNFSPSVQHFDSRRIRDMPRLANLRLILALGQHTEWLSKRQIANYVES